MLRGNIAELTGNIVVITGAARDSEWAGGDLKVASPGFNKAIMIDPGSLNRI